jgi:hypothetical protein
MKLRASFTPAPQEMLLAPSHYNCSDETFKHLDQSQFAQIIALLSYWLQSC